MSKKKVRLREHRRIYIHNDLSNTAYYFKNRITERLSNGDEDGIALEMIAGLTITAFAVEANFNFLGWKLINGWNEYQGFCKKVEQVCNHLSVDVDWDNRPFATIKKLKEFRDTLAHGKPEVLENEEEVILTDEELNNRGWLTPEWEKFLSEDFVTEAYDDMEEIWKSLLGKSGLALFDTVTGGSSSIRFIEHVEE